MKLLEPRTFLSRIKSSFPKAFVLVLPLMGAFLWMIIFSYLSQRLKVILPMETEFNFWIWSIVTTIIALAGLSFFFALLFLLSFICVEKKSLIFSSKIFSFWFGSFLLSLIFIIVFNFVRLFAHYGANLLGELFGLNLGAAQGVFTTLYYLAMVGFAIFFSYAPSILIVQKVSCFKAVKRSFLLVKKIYLPTLVISVVYFIVANIMELREDRMLFSISVDELLNLTIIYPLLALILTTITVIVEDKS